MSERITKNLFDISSLRITAILLNKPITWKFYTVFGHKYVMTENDAVKVKDLIGTASRLVSKYGYVSVEDLTSKSSDALLLENSKRILDYIPDINWLDEDRDFFFFRSRRNTLISAIARILSISKSIDVGEIKEALRRNRRIVRVPSREMLRRICGLVEGLKVQGEFIVADPPIKPSDVLSENYLKIISIFDRNGSVLSYQKLRKEAQILGINSTTFEIYLSNGQLIKSLGSDLYALRGQNIDPILLSRLQIERENQKKKHLFDMGYTSEGKMWVKSNVDVHLLRTGYINLPQEIIGLIKNSYEIVDNEYESFGKLIKGKIQCWGLKKILLSKGADIEDFLCLIFHGDAGKVIVSVGDEQYVDDVIAQKNPVHLPEDTQDDWHQPDIELTEDDEALLE